MHGQVRPQGPVLLGTPVAGGSPPGGLPPPPGAARAWRLVSSRRPERSQGMRLTGKSQSLHFAPEPTGLETRSSSRAVPRRRAGASSSRPARSLGGTSTS